MFVLSQSFSNNSNLIILVDIERLHEDQMYVFQVVIIFCLKEAFLLSCIYSTVKASEIFYIRTIPVTPSKD